MADDVADSEIWVPSDLKDLAVASSSSSSNHSSLSLGDCEMLLAERSPAADDPEPCSAATAWASSPTSSGVAATICGSSSSQLQLQAIPDVMPIRQFMQAISSRLHSFLSWLQRPPANNFAEVPVVVDDDDIALFGIDVRDEGNAPEQPLADGGVAVAAQESETAKLAPIVSDFLVAVQRCGQQVRDEEGHRIVDHSLCQRNAAMNSGSFSSQAADLNTSRAKLRETRIVHASASLCLLISDVRRLLIAIVADTTAAGGSCVSLTLYVRYDETPMKLVVADSDELWGLGPEFFSTKDVAADSLAVLNKTIRDCAPAKLLQTEYKLAALVCIGARYYLFVFDVVTPIQSLGKTTSCAYWAALKRSEDALGLGDIKSKFAFVQRCACTDGDNAIDRAERALQVARPKEQTLRTKCVLHRFCGIRVSVLDIAPHIVKQTKHVVLSLKFGNHMKLFRTAFRTVALKKLKIVRETRPSAAVARRNLEALRRFWPDGDEFILNSHTLLSICIGDWTDKSRLVHHAPPEVTDATVKAKVVGPFTAAMIGKGPHSFPSRNFLHVENSLQVLGAMELVHGLFTDTYKEFCLYLQNPSQAFRGVGVPPPAALDGGAQVEVLALADVAHTDDPAAADPAGEGDPQAADSTATWQARQKEQAQFRKTGLAWVESGHVLRDMAIAMTTMEPHVQVMATEFHFSGDKFEKAERVAEAKATKAHGDGEGVASNELPYSRRYRLLLAYEGASTKPFLENTHQLMHEHSAWANIPMEFRTQEQKSMTFRMLARGKARVHALARSRKNYPYLLLASYKKPELRPQVAADRACPRRMDPWSAAVVNHFDDLDSPDLINHLNGCVLYGREDTLDIERGHTRIRGFVHKRSVQAQAVDLEALNEHWVSAFFEGPAHGLWGRRSTASTSKSEAARAARAAEPQGEPNKRKRKLSLWNVFWAEQSSGKVGGAVPSAAELSAKYKLLGCAELKSLREKAAKAQDAADEGSDAPLGINQRQALQLATASRATLARLCDVGGASSSLSLAVAKPHDLWDLRSALSRQIRGRRALARQRESEAAEMTRATSERGGYAERLAQPLSELPATSAGLKEELSLMTSAMTTKPSLLLMEYHNPDCRKHAGLIAGARSKRAKGAKFVSIVSQMHQCLKLVWKQHAKMVQHEPIAEVLSSEADVPSPDARLCFIANECRCGASGKALSKIEAAISAATKRGCGLASGYRPELIAGKIVLMFIGNLPRQEDDPVEGATTSSVKFLHVADLSLSPYYLFYHELQARSGPAFVQHLRRDGAAAERLVINDRISLITADREYDHYEVSHLFDRSMRWEAVLLEEVTSEAIEGHWVPDGMEVAALPGNRLHSIWDPTAKPRKRKDKEIDDDWKQLLAERDSEDDSDANEHEEGGEDCDGEETGVHHKMTDYSASEHSHGFSSGGSAASDEAASHAEDSDVHDGGDEDAGIDAAAYVVPHAPALPYFPPVAVPAEAPVRTKITFVIDFIGEIVWYRVNLHRQEFYAYCHDSDHIRTGVEPEFDPTGDLKPRYCRKVRSSSAGEFHGRPLGFLAAWLQEQSNTVNSLHHVHGHTPITRAMRIASRDWLWQMPGSVVLFERERPLADGEDAEPA